MISRRGRQYLVHCESEPRKQLVVLRAHLLPVRPKLVLPHHLQRNEKSGKGRKVSFGTCELTSELRAKGNKGHEAADLFVGFSTSPLAGHGRGVVVRSSLKNNLHARAPQSVQVSIPRRIVGRHTHTHTHTHLGLNRHVSVHRQHRVLLEQLLHGIQLQGGPGGVRNKEGQ